MERKQVEELQAMATSMQYIEEEVQELDMQVQLLNNSIQELKATMEMLDGLKDLGDVDETECIFPVGSGTQLRTTIKKPEKFIVSLGAGYWLEQDIDKSLSLLEMQQEKLEKSKELVEGRVKKLVEQAEQIRPLLESRYNQYTSTQAEAMRARGGAGVQGNRVDMDDD